MEPVIVERLRVTASAPLESLVGFAARIEDALRTASLPAEWRGRCVLVRRLRLRAGQGWPAHRIARRLESLWRIAEARPVHAATASDAAPAVWFEDETSARLALIERLARRKDVSAWFWRRLLPAGDLELQLARLASDCLRDCHSARIERDFAAICRAIGEPALIDRVIALIDPVLLCPLFPGAASPVSRFDDHDGDSAAGSAALPQGRDAQVRELGRQLARIALRGADMRGDVDRRTEPSTARGDSIAALGQWSDWAGIFFALNLLRRADAPPGLDAVAGLRAIASWLRVAPDDSLLARLDELDLRVRPQATDPNPDAAALLRSVRIACLRATRRPLRRVLRRGGHITLNRTHLTVSFRLAEVSLPVRVAGLDIDPGWIAPLARVVRFEYD
jgi:hypothetical protein